MHISYYDPFSIFPLLQPNIESKLPLTNLHWRTNGVLKSIPKLPVDLVEETPKRPANVLVKIMFIKSASLDVYKNQMRPLIKEWLKSMGPSEWMIVYHSPLKKDKYNFKTSIFEKVKNDFGMVGKELADLGITTSRDNCFRLKETNDNEINKLEIYSEFMNNIKERILTAFSDHFEVLNRRIYDCKEKDLFYVDLLLKKARNLTELFLFKDAERVLNDASKILSLYLRRNYHSFDKKVPSGTYKYHCEEIDILKESDLFTLKHYVFHQKVDLIFKLIENESLYSINSLYISNLFQEIIRFCNELTQDFGIAVIPFNFSVIDYYLNHKTITTIFNYKDEEIDISTVFEFRGELKLFKRSNLLKVGSLYYKIFDFLEVPLEDPPKVSGELETILASKDSYYDYFQQLTESIIEDFVVCNRTKTLDVLSIDLAALNYERGNYKECLDILQDSYEFFINNGWNYMGGKLLEVYIKCIEHTTTDKKLLINSYIGLFSNLILTASKIDINNFKNTKTKEDVLDILQAIIDNSDSLDTDFIVTMNKLLHVELKPYLSFDKHYFINVEIQNLFEISTKLESVELKLSNGQVFKTEDIVISKKSQTIRLSSNTFEVGFFKPVKITVSLNSRLKLVQDLLQDANSIYCFPSTKGLVANIVPNDHYVLGAPSVVVQIDNGDYNIHDITLLFVNAENCQLPPPLKLADLNTHSSHGFEVPIALISDNRVINLVGQVSYYIGEEQFTVTVEKTLNLDLLLSVTVQDIFKVDAIYSKFQISSIVDTPIRIITSELINTNPNYTIIAPKVKPSNCVVLNDQAYLSFHKIITHDSYKLTDEFKFSVEFLSILRECQVCLMTILELEECTHAFSDLILPRLKFDYGEYLNSRLVVRNTKEVEDIVADTTKFLAPESQKTFKNKVLAKLLEPQVISQNVATQTLDIQVLVPYLDILHIIEFIYEKKTNYVVGEQIPVELTIKSSTKWSGKQPAEDISIIAESSIMDEDQRVELSINSDDHWLISGFRRKTFEIDPKQKSYDQKLSLVLVPLTVGKLQLPKIKLTSERDLVTDTVVHNGNEYLLVTPALDTITFSF